jgi:hypothetical protein
MTLLGIISSRMTRSTSLLFRKMHEFRPDYMSVNTSDIDNVGFPASLVSEAKAQAVKQGQPTVRVPETPKKVDEMEDAVMVDRVNTTAAITHAPLEAGASWIPVNEVNADMRSTEGTNDDAVTNRVPKGYTTDLSLSSADFESNDDPAPDNPDATENIQGPSSDLEAANPLVPSLQQVSHLIPSPRSCSDPRNTSRLSSNASVSPSCTQVSGFS